MQVSSWMRQIYEQAQLLRQETLKEKDVSQFIDFLYIDTL